MSPSELPPVWRLLRGFLARALMKMTVSQLIELLEEFDPDVPVRIAACVSDGTCRVLEDVWLDPRRTGSFTAATLVFPLESSALLD